MRLPALLLLMLDSRSPAGAHSHSGGMEAAIEAGWVRDLADVERFCRGRLRTSGLVTASAAAAAARLPLDEPTAWRDLDDEVSARIPSEAMRIASRQLGSGLRRLLHASVPSAPLAQAFSLIDGAPHQPLVLGAACTLSGADPATAALAAALSTCTASASAAVRLLGLDPFGAHAMLARLAPEIDRLAATASDLDEVAADSAPALDLLADFQLTREVRLFAS
jgi:urease accessory protein